MNLLLLTLLIIVTVCLAQGLDRELPGNLRIPNRELQSKDCFSKNLNGLPHSFTGVRRCDDRMHGNLKLRIAASHLQDLYMELWR